MGLSPSEKSKVLSGLNRLDELEERIAMLEDIIDNFKDVRKARAEAEAEVKREQAAKDRADRKARAEEEQAAKVRAAQDADAKAKKAAEEAERLKAEAGLTEPEE